MEAKSVKRYRFGWKYHLLIISLTLLGLLGYWYGVVRNAYPTHRNDLWMLAVIGLGFFYVNFVAVWPAAIAERKHRLTWIVLIFAANHLILFGVLIYLSVNFGNLEIHIMDMDIHDVRTLLDGSVSNFVPYVFPVSVGVVTSLFAFLIESIYHPFATKDESERELQKVKLAWRQAQLDPHLLDSHLVLLRVITAESPEKAQAAFDRTVEVIQFYIGGNKPGADISFEKEVACVRNMMMLQRIRYGDSLNWLLEIDGDITGIATMPMVVIPLVENMMRYAVLNHPDKPATVQIRVVDTDLLIRAENYVRINHGQKGSGVGLTNLKERLSYVYPSRHQLSIRHQNDRFVVKLALYGIIEKELKL